MTITCAKAMLVSLCTETHYDLPAYAATLARRVTDGKTTYRQLFEDAFGGAVSKLSDQAAAQYFWFAAGMAATRTLAINHEQLRPLAARDNEMRHMYQGVLEAASHVRDTARGILIAGNDRPLLREFMDTSYELMADRPKSQAMRRILLKKYIARTAPSVTQGTAA